jgi:CheY-like chemotaxis protein
MRQKKFYEEIPIGSLPTTVFVNARLLPRKDALRTALVVDDDRKNAETLVMVLRANGYLAEAAYSGEEGLARAKELRPGVIISDVGLPKMDGLTMVDAIGEFLPHAKIVLICESLPGNMEVTSWSVLKKPVRALELLAVLKVPSEMEN